MLRPPVANLSWEHEESGLRLPGELGEMMAEQVFGYEKAALGCSVRDSDRKAWMRGSEGDCGGADRQTRSVCRTLILSAGLFVSLIHGRGCWHDEDDVSDKIRAKNWMVEIDLDVHSSAESLRGGIGGAMPESGLLGIDEVADLLSVALLKSD